MVYKLNPFFVENIWLASRSLGHFFREKKLGSNEFSLIYFFPPEGITPCSSNLMSKYVEMPPKKEKTKKLNNSGIFWRCLESLNSTILTKNSTHLNKWSPLESFASFLPRQPHGWPQDRSNQLEVKTQFQEGYGMNGKCKGWTGWNLKKTRNNIQEVILHLLKFVDKVEKGACFSLTYHSWRLLTSLLTIG